MSLLEDMKVIENLNYKRTIKGTEIDLGMISDGEIHGKVKSTLQGNNHTAIVEEMRQVVGSKMDALFASLTNGNVNISIYDENQFSQAVRRTMSDVDNAVDRLEQEVRALGDTIKYAGN